MRGGARAWQAGEAALSLRSGSRAAGAGGRVRASKSGVPPSPHPHLPASGQPSPPEAGAPFPPQLCPQEALQRLVSLYGLLHGLQVSGGAPEQRAEPPGTRDLAPGGGERGRGDGATHMTARPPSTQAAVAQQDTLMEARFPEGPERREKLARANSRDGEAGRAGAPPAAPEKQATELALLQRQHALLQEELRRCRRLGEERAAEAGSLEARLRESEQARAVLEREAEEARRRLAALGQTEPLPTEAPWARRPLDPRRRSLPAGDALYLSFTPPQVRKLGAPGGSSGRRDGHQEGAGWRTAELSGHRERSSSVGTGRGPWASAEAVLGPSGPSAPRQAGPAVWTLLIPLPVALPAAVHSPAEAMTAWICP